MAERKREKTRYPGVYYRIAADGRTRHYEIMYRGTDGKQRFQRVQGGEKDAVEKRNQILAQMAHGVKVAPTKLRVEDWAREWLEERTNLRPKTRSSYDWAIEKQIVPRLGRIRVCDLGVNDVARMIADMQTEGKKAWTIRGVLTPLSGMMKTAVRRGFATANPVEQLERSERPQSDQAAMNILDSNEIQLMLSKATETYRPLLATAIFTGLRVGELLELRWEDIDWSAGIINVCRSKTRAGQREVVMIPALQKVLAEYSLKHEGTFVFETVAGDQMKHRTVYRRALEATLKRAGITKRIRFHDLRHTYASILISQGYDLAHIAEQMGHSTPAITLRIYGHLLDRARRREEHREKLEAAFGEVLQP